MNNPLPDAQRVAKRVLAQLTICDRAHLEEESEGIDSPEEFCESAKEWLQDCGAVDELEPQEFDLLNSEFGSLSQQERINSVWRIEGIGTLLWALNSYNLPPDATLVSPAEMFEVTQAYDSDATRLFLSQAQLRPADELFTHQKHVLMLHWRLREFSLRPMLIDFVEFSKDCWIGSFDISGFDIIENDVAINGVPISKADPADVELCGSITRERHQAANWLCGENPVYSEVETNT